MSRLIAKILLAMLMFPLAALMNLIVYVRVDEFNGDPESIFFAAGATWLFMMVYWFALWWGALQWTHERIVKTVIFTLLSIVAGIVAGALLVPNDRDVGYFCACHTTTLLWVGGMIIAWRETPAERAARLGRAKPDTLVCPTCGYNLTGLSEAHCPECGTKFTIDELLAAQSERGAASAVEIER